MASKTKMEKTKVLHVIKSLGRGGAETLLVETLRLHNKDIFDFHYIYFLPWKDQVVPGLKESGGTVVCMDSRNTVQLVTKVLALASYVRAHNIDVIHAHLPWAGIVARVAGRMAGVPVIYTEHNRQERYHAGSRFVNLITMNLSSEVIAVSEDVATSIRENKRRLTSELRTILNGVNTEYFRRSEHSSDLKESLGLPPGAVIVSTVAVFRTQKRLDLWLELAKNISARVDNVYFVLVGDGPLKGELITKRNSLGLDDRVRMPGLQTDVKPYLELSNIFMMSSQFEGLPIALLEAMAMECAVVATSAGGIGEVVRHGVDGYLADVDQPGQLVDFAVELCLNDSLRLEFGRNARKRVEESFSLRRMVSELESLYLKTRVHRGKRLNLW